MKTLIFAAMSLILGAIPASASDLPDGLYYKTSGSCQEGDIGFSAIRFTGYSSGNPLAVDTVIYLTPSGAASILFSVSGSDVAAKVVSTSWKSIDSNKISIQSLGTLSFLMDPFNPTRFSIVAVTVLENAIYPDLPLSAPNSAYAAFPRARVKWNDRGQTDAQLCGY